MEHLPRKRRGSSHHTIAYHSIPYLHPPFFVLHLYGIKCAIRNEKRKINRKSMLLIFFSLLFSSLLKFSLLLCQLMRGGRDGELWALGGGVWKERAHVSEGVGRAHAQPIGDSGRVLGWRVFCSRDLWGNFGPIGALAAVLLLHSF